MVAAAAAAAVTGTGGEPGREKPLDVQGEDGCICEVPVGKGQVGRVSGSYMPWESHPHLCPPYYAELAGS